MKITISHLTSRDLTAVDDLMKRHSNMLGFLPREALDEYLEKGGRLGATPQRLYRLTIRVHADATLGE